MNKQQKLSFATRLAIAFGTSVGIAIGLTANSMLVGIPLAANVGGATAYVTYIVVSGYRRKQRDMTK